MLKSIAIYTVHTHHGANSGYKQILKTTRPFLTAGITDTTKRDKFLSYYYKYEFIAWFKALFTKVDVVHVLYGEDYFRFSHLLFWRKPLVVTFHQPESILKQELSRGDYNGKVAGYTHRLTSNRFKKVNAVILTSENQYKIACDFFNPKKIHVLPLGIHINMFNKLFYESNIKRNNNLFITVGEWQRDWEMYIKQITYLNKNISGLEFVIVNNKLSNVIAEKLENIPNVNIKNNISDSDLYNLYLTANAMLLPLKGAAGNNAINESLALGCLIISNIEFNTNSNNAVFQKYSSDDELLTLVKHINNINVNTRQDIALQANKIVQNISWDVIGNKTLEVYKKAIQNKKNKV